MEKYQKLYAKLYNLLVGPIWIPALMVVILCTVIIDTVQEIRNTDSIYCCYLWGQDVPVAQIEPRVISLDFQFDDDSAGGVIVVDLNNDGQRDLLVTRRGFIGAYTISGQRLWTKEVDIQVSSTAEENGLPGHHGPGVQSADIDGDGTMEVLYLTRRNELHVVRGDNGRILRILQLPSPKESKRWEHLVIANFRGQGDRDILLQATNLDGYRQGHFVAAYSLDNILNGDEPIRLWQRDDFISPAHNGARLADLDFDGRDEVIGATILSSEGEITTQLPIDGHLDGIYVGDIRPDLPGLEVLGAEEGPQNRVFLYNQLGIITETDYRQWEPQNIVIGEFDDNYDGLEMWCRSRFNVNQRPFIFDARGNLIAQYDMSSVVPSGWTKRGVEVINTIDWTGDEKQLIVAKERHTSGNVVIFDAITGQFFLIFTEEADRLYVADVVGDWREEIIVLNKDEIHIYANPEPNPNPRHGSLWTQDHYRRNKMTWNYYSP